MRRRSQVIPMVLGAFLLLGSAPALAQEPAQDTEGATRATPAIPSDIPIERTQTGRLIWPVLVFDREVVLSTAEAGKALVEEVEAARSALLAENAQIYADLEAEEREISDQRATMTEEAFRARAAAFDDKVTEVRSTQDQKARDIQTLYDDGLQKLERQMNEVLSELARDVGAVMVFERQQVYLASSAVDVSIPLITEMNAQFSSDASGSSTGVTTRDTTDTP